MERRIEDFVCEMIPDIWLAYDPVSSPDNPIVGTANVWDAMIKPKMYLEDMVRELCSKDDGWKKVIAEKSNDGYPKYYRARLTLEIRDNGERK